MTTVPKISFGETSFGINSLSERQRKREVLIGISNMTDEEILEASMKNAQKTAENSKAARVLKQGPSLFIAASSMGIGLLSKGSLSNKALNTAKSAIATSIIFGLSKPVCNIVEGSIDSFSKDKEEKTSKKHPISTLALDVLGLAVASAFMFRGIDKGANFLKKTFEPTYNVLKNNLKNTAQKLDNSYAGKLSDKFSKSLQNFETLHPEYAKLTKAIISFAPVSAFVAGSVSLANKVSKIKEQKAASNINKLALCRLYAQEIEDKNNID